MVRNPKQSRILSARLRPHNLLENKDAGASQDTRKGVQSVDHAFAILGVFEQAQGALAVKDVADHLGLTPSKVHHYLVSLVRSGALRQNSSGTYDLGAFALQLGLSAMRKLEPIELGAVAARNLRDQTGEAVFMSVWGSYGPTILRYYEGFQPVTVEARAGLVLPVLTSATGHVFATWGVKTLVEPVLENEGTARSLDQIMQRTKEAGLGSVDGDLLPRVASLSAPVFDQEGRLSLALTALGWSGELDISLSGPLAKQLLLQSQNLSRQLGVSLVSS